MRATNSSQNMTEREKLQQSALKTQRTQKERRRKGSTKHKAPLYAYLVIGDAEMVPSVWCHNEGDLAKQVKLLLELFGEDDRREEKNAGASL